MDVEAIRLLIRQKLWEGRLSHDRMSRFWGRPGQGELCNACETPVTTDQMMAGDFAPRLSGTEPSRMHARCFQLWDAERAHRTATREAAMDQEALRRLIRGKLQNGRLPQEGVKRIWSSPSAGETCDACDTVLAKDQVLMEGVTLDLGRSHMLQLHVRCFQMWDHERRAA
jgi:hypothetical protein